MYDRYTIFTGQKQLESIFKASFEKDFQPCYNAAPTRALPVVLQDNPGHIVLLHWGLISNMANNRSLSPRLFNVPATNLLDRPAYQKSLENHRCLILANGFYSWKQVSKKQRVPHFCYYQGYTPFGIAGLWEDSDYEGDVTRCFTMITVPSTHELRQQQEDMPAVLDQERIQAWLRPDASRPVLEDTLKTILADRLLMHPVSPLLTDPNKNGDQLIKPAPPADQHGNYTLFS